ncbi:MAG: leucyl aminopeptidase family protein, partial [Ruegeria sp.]|nr:leucyl aminopeptidase family protein [Ruegeria sp.]
IADLDNAPSGGFAGSITAALFLRRFVGDSRYMHFDIYSWQRSKEPGRSKGGLGQGPRALLTALPKMLNL